MSTRKAVIGHGWSPDSHLGSGPPRRLHASPLLDRPGPTGHLQTRVSDPHLRAHVQARHTCAPPATQELAVHQWFGLGRRDPAPCPAQWEDCSSLAFSSPWGCGPRRPECPRSARPARRSRRLENAAGRHQTCAAQPTALGGRITPSVGAELRNPAVPPWNSRGSARTGTHGGRRRGAASAGQHPDAATMNVDARGPPSTAVRRPRSSSTVRRSRSPRGCARDP